MKKRINRIRIGIAAYEKERLVILRLLRKRGVFTGREFDRWFIGREWRRPIRISPVLCDDSFILGSGMSHWSMMFELLQAMVAVGDVKSKKKDGEAYYQLPNG